MVLLLENVKVEGFGAFARAGYAVPQFDRDLMRARADAAPVWLHLGAGNLFRSFHARIAQTLLDRGLLQAGIHLLDTRDHARVARFHELDDLFVDVVMSADGEPAPTVVGSVARSMHVGSPSSAGWPEATRIAAAPSLQLVTLAVTEKAYAVRAGAGDPAESSTTMELLAALLLARYHAGAAPLAVVSTDNFAGNGDRVASAIRAVAGGWLAAGTVEQGFLAYLDDEHRVAFPSTMIDRITPVPDPAVGSALADRFDLGETAVRQRSNGNPLADFSNTEEFHLLVVEDSFPNGRPPFEAAGVLFTDRETVDRVERMKVGACLNPLHTAMAVFGCLLGFTAISAEARDPDVASMLRRLAEDEALPALEPPGIIDPQAFLDDVLERRLVNTGLPDTPQRIATDTSQKLEARFGRTIGVAVDAGTDGRLRFVPLVIAGWIRYLLGVDDLGRDFAVSPDPLRDRLQHQLRDVHWNQPASLGDAVRRLLAEREIFGADLSDSALAASVEVALRSLLGGPGAVRTTLHRAVSTPTLAHEGVFA
jgi:fructuronate reductase